MGGGGGKGKRGRASRLRVTKTGKTEVGIRNRVLGRTAEIRRKERHGIAGRGHPEGAMRRDAMRFDGFKKKAELTHESDTFVECTLVRVHEEYVHFGVLAGGNEERGDVRRFEAKEMMEAKQGASEVNKVSKLSFCVGCCRPAQRLITTWSSENE